MFKMCWSPYPAGVFTCSTKSSQELGAVQSGWSSALPVTLGATNGPPLHVVVVLVSLTVPFAGVAASALPSVSPAASTAPTAPSRTLLLRQSDRADNVFDICDSPGPRDVAGAWRSTSGTCAWHLQRRCSPVVTLHARHASVRFVLTESLDE